MEAFSFICESLWVRGQREREWLFDWDFFHPNLESDQEWLVTWHFELIQKSISCSSALSHYNLNFFPIDGAILGDFLFFTLVVILLWFLGGIWCWDMCKLIQGDLSQKPCMSTLNLEFRRTPFLSSVLDRIRKICGDVLSFWGALLSKDSPWKIEALVSILRSLDVIKFSLFSWILLHLRKNQVAQFW